MHTSPRNHHAWEGAEKCAVVVSTGGGWWAGGGSNSLCMGFAPVGTGLGTAKTCGLVVPAGGEWPDGGGALPEGGGGDWGKPRADAASESISGRRSSATAATLLCTAMTSCFLGATVSACYSVCASLRPALRKYIEMVSSKINYWMKD
jgi:hypothetical protein